MHDRSIPGANRPTNELGGDTAGSHSCYAPDPDTRNWRGRQATPLPSKRESEYDRRAQNSSVWIAIRPEKMTLHKDADTPAVPECAAAHNVVKGEIKDISYLGDISIYHVLLTNGRLTGSRGQTARAGTRTISALARRCGSVGRARARS